MTSLAGCQPCIVTGTPFGTWTLLVPAMSPDGDALVQILSDALGDGDADAISKLRLSDEQSESALWAANQLATAVEGADWIVEARAAWAIDELAGACPAALWLLFVESPAEAIGNSLDRAAPSDVLWAWSLAARKMLRLRQRVPQRCLMIDVDEARRAPERFISRVADFVGVAAGMPVPLSLPAQCDPLRLAVGAAALASDRSVQALLAELLACCDPLEEALPAQSPVSCTVADAAAVVYKEQVAQKLALLGATVALENERVERELLLTTMHRTAAEKEALKQQLTQQLTQAQGVLHRRRREVLRHRMVRSNWRAQMNDASALLQSARIESDLLLRQLHRVHAAAEAAAPAAGEGDAPVVLQVASVTVEHERIDLPYRELTVRLWRVVTGSRSFEKIDLRLVDHHGRAGLVIFAGDADSPLYGWVPSGEESGRPFMTLIPKDDANSGRLARLGRSDWDLMQAIVARIGLFLREPGRPLSSCWRDLARRLVADLSVLPARLRYDAVDLSPEVEGADQGAYRVTFTAVLFGQRRFDKLSLTWRPVGRAGAPLELRCPPSPANLPWSGWPVDAANSLLASRPFPLGPSMSADEKTRTWREMAAADRALLCAVLDALLGAVKHAPDMVRTTLVADAAALLVEARRALGLTRLKYAMRGLRGRYLNDE